MCFTFPLCVTVCSGAFLQVPQNNPGAVWTQLVIWVSDETIERLERGTDKRSVLATHIYSHEFWTNSEANAFVIELTGASA